MIIGEIMKAKYEEKFLAINRKRFDELNYCTEGSEMDSGFYDHPAIASLKIAVNHFIDVYERVVGKKVDQN